MVCGERRCLFLTKLCKKIGEKSLDSFDTSQTALGDSQFLPYVIIRQRFLQENHIELQSNKIFKQDLEMRKIMFRKVTTQQKNPLNFYSVRKRNCMLLLFLHFTLFNLISTVSLNLRSKHLNRLDLVQRSDLWLSLRMLSLNTAKLAE